MPVLKLKGVRVSLSIVTVVALFVRDILVSVRDSLRPRDSVPNTG